MVFDANAYRATVNDYRRQGDMNALEGYLTQEIARLRESGTICAGVACTCGKDADALAEEDAAWQHNREQGLVVALSDLADLYRSSGAWYKCLKTYEELRQCLIDEGLENTPMQVLWSMPGMPAWMQPIRSALLVLSRRPLTLWAIPTPRFPLPFCALALTMPWLFLGLCVALPSRRSRHRMLPPRRSPYAARQGRTSSVPFPTTLQLWRRLGVSMRLFPPCAAHLNPVNRL